MSGVNVRGQAAKGRRPGGKRVPKRPENSFIIFNRKCDYSLAFMVLFLVLFGMVVLYSAIIYKETGLAARQLKFGIGGIFAMLVVSRINYRYYEKLSPILFVVSIFLMLLVFVGLGVTRNNSARWLSIAGVSFQPAELFKIAVILFNAFLLNKLGKRVMMFKATVFMIALALFEGFLVLLLTDNLSSAIIVIVIAMCMLFVAKPNKAALAIAVTLVVVSIAVVVVYFSNLDLTNEQFLALDFRYQRILRWLKPERYSFDGKNYQTLQSLYAIGSGSLMGKGLGHGIQKVSIPEVMNDMIYAVVCEELGYIGATFLLVLYGLLMQRLLFIARNSREIFGGFVATGIMAHIGIQVALNVAVATNSMPNTGVTLPFFSYGGTALLILLGEMGIALSISRLASIE